MASHLDDTQIYYGYFRVVEQVDKSVTAKFGTLKLMTNNVSPLLRGKVATHAGFIQSLLQPSQVIQQLFTYFVEHFLLSHCS